MFSDRRWYGRLVLFLKVINGLVPTYLSSLIPEMREQRYDLRKTNSIVAPKCRTDTLKSSFSRTVSMSGTTLVWEFREERSLSLFRTRLIGLVRPMKGQMYGIHDLFGVRRLTQLRVGLSPLRDHTFRHNFLDTNDPMRMSNEGIENTIHYMLLCQEYTVHRTVLLGKLVPICASYGVDCKRLSSDGLLLLLLYDNNAFNESSNKNILSATVFYINSTNKFIWPQQFFCFILLFSY